MARLGAHGPGDPLSRPTSTDSNRPSSRGSIFTLRCVALAGEVADGQGQCHRTGVTLPLCESQIANPLLILS